MLVLTLWLWQGRNSKRGRLPRDCQVSGAALKSVPGGRFLGTSLGESWSPLLTWKDRAGPDSKGAGSRTCRSKRESGMAGAHSSPLHALRLTQGDQRGDPGNTRWERQPSHAS